MESHIKEALEIVKVQASVRAMNAEEITTMLKRLAEGIRAIKDSGVSFSAEEGNLINPQKAIRKIPLPASFAASLSKFLPRSICIPMGIRRKATGSFAATKKEPRLSVNRYNVIVVRR